MQEQTVKNMVVHFDLLSASQDLLKARALQKRVDTKFLVALDDFEYVLSACQETYALVKAQDREIARYRTRYWDTKDLQCLSDHHRGRRPRYKFRFRHYIDRQKTYFEVKAKTPANRTRKTRLRVDYGQEDLGAKETTLVERCSAMDATLLKPGLGIEFSRLMLVGIDSMERATFDINFRAKEGDRQATFPHVVIAELKQARFVARSPMMLLLRKYGRRIDSMSKYCVGSMLVRPGVSLQRYKPTLRLLRSMS
ncbi:MAG: polyphosphate polymerase domain-containing protein [Myxococcota bacterium]|nr:polyphosphate polymerase domain-containing protein [Myxococcota bacterium]